MELKELKVFADLKTEDYFLTNTRYNKENQRKQAK